jgi:hypothetical protein
MILAAIAHSKYLEIRFASTAPNRIFANLLSNTCTWSLDDAKPLGVFIEII